MKVNRIALLALAGLCLGGCGTSYSWRSSVPREMRTVTVPTFRNESDVAELGAVATRQILREFQREGTFRIATASTAALEIQGTVRSAVPNLNAYDRRGGGRFAAYDFQAEAVVTVVDKRGGRVLVDNRVYTAKTMMTGSQDVTTARRDASGRLMEDLATQIVDDVLRMKW